MSALVSGPHVVAARRRSVDTLDYTFQPPHSANHYDASSRRTGLGGLRGQELISPKTSN